MAGERDRMLRGDLYNAADPELVAVLRRARALLRALNTGADETQRPQLIAQLFGAVG